jgi:hypothetical protein
MTEFPATFFVPTLDIDLAWHSHQLRGKQYMVDMTSDNTRTDTYWWYGRPIVQNM